MLRFSLPMTSSCVLPSSPCFIPDFVSWRLLPFLFFTLSLSPTVNLLTLPLLNLTATCSLFSTNRLGFLSLLCCFALLLLYQPTFFSCLLVSHKNKFIRSFLGRYVPLMHLCYFSMLLHHILPSVLPYIVGAAQTFLSSGSLENSNCCFFCILSTPSASSRLLLPSYLTLSRGNTSAEFRISPWQLLVTGRKGWVRWRVFPLHFSQWWSKNAKGSGQSNARLMWPPEMTVQHDYCTESYFTDVEELIFWAFWQCNKLHLRVYKKCGKQFSYCLPHWDFRKSITLKQVTLINSPVKACCITLQILSNPNSDSELCFYYVNHQ